MPEQVKAPATKPEKYHIVEGNKQVVHWPPHRHPGTYASTHDYMHTQAHTNVISEKMWGILKIKVFLKKTYSLKHVDIKKEKLKMDALGFLLHTLDKKPREISASMNIC